LFYNKRVIFIN